jgi:hypothetical protein
MPARSGKSAGWPDVVVRICAEPNQSKPVEITSGSVEIITKSCYIVIELIEIANELFETVPELMETVTDLVDIVTESAGIVMALCPGHPPRVGGIATNVVQPPVRGWPGHAP